MSRTYRRKSGDKSDLKWQTSNLVRVAGTWNWEWVPMDPSSKEYKSAVSKYYADHHRNFKEPGPSWFRNLFTERPQRREAKRQLKEYIARDQEYEVILNAKDPLEYWT